MKITVTRAEPPGEGSRPDLYITTESSVVPDWPSVRTALLRKTPDLFDGYNDRPSDWFTDPCAEAGVFIDTWLVTGKEKP